MNVKLFLTDRRVRRATGVLSIAASLFVSSTVFPTALQATSETQESNVSELKVPADITEESIEAIDADLAKAAGPFLRTLFDTGKPADERQRAAAELRSLANNFSAATAEKDSLRRRLQRRVALISSSLAALQSTSGGTASSTADLTNAASSTVAWLSSIANGVTWVSYLHLNDLQQPDVSPDVLKQVANNLTPSDAMNADQKAFASRPQLQRLKVAVEKAIRLSNYAGPAEAVQGEQKYYIDLLIQSLLSYESDQLGSHAENARVAWRTLRNEHPAAASALRSVVNDNYFNHNLHFVVSEDLLSRVISDYRTESGCIAECIMGAWVTGSQQTNVNLRADIKPSSDRAMFDLNVNGTVHSSTVAQKSPATIWSRGNNSFWMNKSVVFDGRHVTSTAASFDVNTSSQVTGLATKFDGIPIIRGIVRNIASQKIAESKPQSEALTARKIRDAALPKFESESNQQFSTANSTLNQVLASLERRGVGPDSTSARSSNTHMALSTRTIGVSRLGGSLQPPSALIATGAAVQLHESALNNAIDALGLQGRTILEKDLARELEIALTDLFQRPIKLTDGVPQPAEKDAEPEPPTSFVFSNSDPIRVHFENNQITLVLRAGVLQEGKDEIPEQIITIPIDMSLQGGKVVLEPGKIGVASKEETDRLKQITRANQIRRILSRRLIRREMSPTIDVQAAGDKTLLLTVTMIQLMDGWLSAELM
ncbi:MAG: hypothetical protein KDB01_10130 [Planctomycetaceae bacterium]|nr:hypothetical protein [Planctomycetaceae bacterium]